MESLPEHGLSKLLALHTLVEESIGGSTALLLKFEFFEHDLLDAGISGSQS